MELDQLSLSIKRRYNSEQKNSLFLLSYGIIRPQLKEGVVSMKLLNKLIPVTGAVIGVIVPFISPLAPSVITVVGGGLIGLIAGAAIVTGISLLFNEDETVTEANKEQRPPKRKRTERKKVQKRNTYSLEKKKDARGTRPVKNILTLDDEEESIKTSSVNQKQPANIFKLDDEDEQIKTTTTNHPVKNILKLDDEEDIEQEKAYSLNPISQKQKVLFQDPYNQTAISGKNNLRVNDEKIINDVKNRLEQLKKTLTETQKQINEIRMILDDLQEQQENSRPKVKMIS